jgi:hypothetical protein
MDSNNILSMRALGGKQKCALADTFSLAGREGFEPSVDTRPTTVFETVPFNHSGTFPDVEQDDILPYKRARL